jgi:glyoxylase-like metal-dependent hydrolase (beta-lactamase superfamily II)
MNKTENFIFLLPDLYVIPDSCMVYLISSSQGFILIDCGEHITNQTIINNFKNAGNKKVTHLFLTHCHADHVLGAETFQKDGAKIFAHINTATAMEKKLEQVWYEHPELVKPVKVDIVLNEDNEIEIDNLKIKTIWTPGHTSGCMSYLIKINNKLCLFTGDLITPAGDLGWSGSVDFDKEEVINTLEKLNKINFDLMFGGHWYLMDKKCIKEGITKGESGKLETR